MPRPSFPRVKPNDPVRADLFNLLVDKIEALYGMRAEAPLSFTTTGGTPMMRLAAVSDATSTRIITKWGVAASIITPASAQSQPGTYGGGTVTLDIDGGAGYTAGDTVDVKNRWPVAFAVGDLLELISNDAGKTWYVSVRYCP